MANGQIKKAAAEKGVRLWKIAERLKITDSTFSRRLRYEMPEEEQRHILRIIDEIARESEVI